MGECPLYRSDVCHGIKQRVLTDLNIILLFFWFVPGLIRVDDKLWS